MELRVQLAANISLHLCTDTWVGSMSMEFGNGRGCVDNDPIFLLFCQKKVGCWFLRVDSYELDLNSLLIFKLFQFSY